jgi:hypothetical protein
VHKGFSLSFSVCRSYEWLQKNGPRYRFLSILTAAMR